MAGVRLRWRVECEAHGYFETESKPQAGYCIRCRKPLEPVRIDAGTKSAASPGTEVSPGAVSVMS